MNKVVDVFLLYPDQLLSVSSSNAISKTASPGYEVVLVSPATTVEKRLASFGLGVVCKPLLFTVTCSTVHRTEAQLFTRVIQLHLRFLYGQFPSHYGWLHNTGFCVDFRCLSGFFWILTFRLARCQGLEIVGIPKAAAVKERLALLTVAVKEVALQQPSTGTRSFVQMTRVLVI